MARQSGYSFDILGTAEIQATDFVAGLEALVASGLARVLVHAHDPPTLGSLIVTVHGVGRDECPNL